jgi:hypothetical protein
MSLGEFLWSLLVIYFIFFYFMILFRIIGDLFSNEEANGWVKTGWIIALLLVPFISIFVYLIMNGKAMTERAVAHAHAVDAANQEYIRQVASTATVIPTQQIAQARDLLEAGAITVQEFETIKAKALV